METTDFCFQHRQNEMGGGGGPGRGPYGGGGGDWGPGRGGGGPPNQFHGGMTTYGVPADKCGLVIGKGESSHFILIDHIIHELLYLLHSV